MKLSLAQRHENMETTLSRMIGRKVELTIRGERDGRFEFTISGEGKIAAELEALSLTVGMRVDSIEYDEELDETFCFTSAAE